MFSSRENSYFRRTLALVRSLVATRLEKHGTPKGVQQFMSAQSINIKLLKECCLVAFWPAPQPALDYSLGVSKTLVTLLTIVRRSSS